MMAGRYLAAAALVLPLTLATGAAVSPDEATAAKPSIRSHVRSGSKFIRVRRKRHRARRARGRGFRSGFRGFAVAAPCTDNREYYIRRSGQRRCQPRITSEAGLFRDFRSYRRNHPGIERPWSWRNFKRHADWGQRTHLWRSKIYRPGW